MEEQQMDFIKGGGRSGILSKPPFSPQTRPYTNTSEAKSLGLSTKNKVLEQFSVEVEGFINDLLQSTRYFHSLSEREKLQFISDQERTISEFSKHLDQYSIGASSNQIQLCESLIFQAQKTLRKITSQNETTEEVEKVIQREARIRELQRETSAVQVHSPAKVRIEEIKRREEKLDKDFIRLMERYNNSKELIENLCFSNNPATQQQQYQQSNNQAGNLLIGSGNFESRLSPKISELPELQPVTSKYLSSNTNYNRTSAIDEGPISGLRNNSKEFAKYDRQSQQILHEKEKNVSKSFKQLKQTINMKENIERDKLDRQKQVIKELKQSLREYIQRTQELEEGMRIKDEVIEKYDREIKNCQEDLVQNIDRLKEMKIKEEGWLKLEEEIREQNIALKSKCARKKQKVKNFREQNIETTKALEEFRDAHENDSRKLREVIEDVSQQNHVKTQKIQDLEQVITAVKESDSLKQQELSRQNSLLEQKIEELRDLQAQLEAKIAKNKIKYEEERKSIQEEKNTEIQKKKEKIVLLKHSQEETADKLNIAERDIIQLKSQLDSLHSQIQDSEQLCEEYKLENKRLIQDFSNSRENIQSAQQENEKLNQQIQLLQERVRHDEKLVDSKDKEIQEIKSQLGQSIEEIQDIKDLNTRATSQIQFLEKKQFEEINDIEGRIDQLIGEIKSLKEENGDLKTKEHSLKRQLNQAEEIQNNFKEKYLKAKSSNKSLREHLKEVEDKVKEYVHERSFENRDHEKQREQAKASEISTKNKLRLLDEIQSMIRQHKTYVNKFE